MLFPRSLFRSLLIIGLLSLFSLPSQANELSASTPGTVVYGKDKKGDDPPRPRPNPGPREGGDDD